jgi:hypothetical protein
LRRKGLGQRGIARREALLQPGHADARLSNFYLFRAGASLLAQAGKVTDSH